jgi:hypothetical protein
MGGRDHLENLEVDGRKYFYYHYVTNKVRRCGMDQSGTVVRTALTSHAFKGGKFD